MKFDPTPKLLVSLLILVQPVLSGMEIRGQTVNGVQFAGNFTSLRSGVLYLSSEKREETDSLGIPVDILESASIEIRKPYGPNLSKRLETLAPLLPHLGMKTISILLEWIRHLGGTGDWTGVYLWSGRVRQTAPDPGFQLEAALLEAQSLLKMGMYRELGLKLVPLNSSVQPIDASPLLCLLNAAFWEWSGDTDKSCFWKQLPELQIPSRDIRQN
ncbi:hypothetical protein G0Q06_08025 [Puniceicoccales bacterium CK1056]|uniref:Uncharacterized protein n=1 Tax=Oceanipulchritudo coccoides TaxID=2706888 RepID=A0A6B2M104_9BACT|nr:hypothetical protein [Oceanipulchritudo coccoides]NDV62393.1 hypothetical protein [Oceanipulchritudo coccoides]